MRDIQAASLSTLINDQAVEFDFEAHEWQLQNSVYKSNCAHVTEKHVDTVNIKRIANNIEFQVMR